MRFITGHTKDTDGLKLNWESLADPDTTLVIYMGLINIREITEQLMAHGLDAETPAAAINQGTRPEQRVLEHNAEVLGRGHIDSTNYWCHSIDYRKVAGLADQPAWFLRAAIPDAQAK